MRVQNLIGFFVEGVTGSGPTSMQLNGYLVPMPGFIAACPSGTCTVTQTASFLNVVVLVR